MGIDYELAKKLGFPKDGYILFEDKQGNCIHAKRTTKAYEHDYSVLKFNCSWIPQQMLNEIKERLVNG